MAAKARAALQRQQELVPHRHRAIGTRFRVSTRAGTAAHKCAAKCKRLPSTSTDCVKCLGRAAGARGRRDSGIHSLVECRRRLPSAEFFAGDSELLDERVQHVNPILVLVVVLDLDNDTVAVCGFLDENRLALSPLWNAA